MKKAYERPLMKAEIFETNAYCGACADQPPVLTGQLVVDLANGNWYSDNRGTAWSGNPAAYITRHTFVEANKVAQTSNYGGLDQYYWKCSCHEGSPYYLEYSANFTENYNNGNPTFFLYKEDTGNQTLELAQAMRWPNDGGRNADEVVAMVSYTPETTPVVNS